MDNLTGEHKATADPAEAEKDIAAAVPEKFKDVKTLVKAYESLEAEFTRRTKKLKELESGAVPPPEDKLLSWAKNSAAVRDAIIGEYLDGLSKNHAVRLVSGGQIAAAPRTQPNSVREAGRLANEFLNK